MTTRMTDRIKRRIVPERPMVSISLRLPEDVIDELKEVAPGMGFNGYQPLIRAFIGQGAAGRTRAHRGRTPDQRTEDRAKDGVRSHRTCPKVVAAQPAFAIKPHEEGAREP